MVHVMVDGGWWMVDGGWSRDAGTGVPGGGSVIRCLRAEAEGLGAG
jgi:hypothetical protein